MKRLVSIVAVIGLIAAACGGSSEGVDVTEMRVSEPAGPNSALYFTATSEKGDRLIGASTDEAVSIQIHETQMDSDGTMAMVRLESLEVPADGELVLEPGGFHLMLIDAEPFEEGSEIEVTLVWENAGEKTYTVEVVAPGDTMGHDH